MEGTGIDTLVVEKKMDYFLIQCCHKRYMFQGCCNAFDPYGCAKQKQKKKKDEKPSLVRWNTPYTDMRKLKQNVQKAIPRDCEGYDLHT